MVTETEKLSPAEHLERRIRENRLFAARWRAEHGDPGEALGKLLVERFGIEALEATYREYWEHEDSFLFDDYEYDDEESGEDVVENGRESQ